MRTIHVGSRKSKLALVQSQQIIHDLSDQFDDLKFSLDHIVTKGDRILDTTLSKIGGKGLFVKEIELALLNGSIDFAVHSMKDMPAALPEGLLIAAIPRREVPADVLVTRDGCPLENLPEGACVGTSSLRRAAQLLHVRDDLKILNLRGNVDTRLKKLEAGDYDAIVLAAAGMKRLGIQANGVPLAFDAVLPAVGQGALAIECRTSDQDLRDRLSKINDPETETTVRAERAFLKKLNGGCQVPIAAYCTMHTDGSLTLTGLVASVDGKEILKTTQTGTEPEMIGYRAAEILLQKGAEQILAEAAEDSDSHER